MVVTGGLPSKGEQREFTSAVRDSEEGKLRPALMYPLNIPLHKQYFYLLKMANQTIYNPQILYKPFIELYDGYRQDTIGKIRSIIMTLSLGEYMFDLEGRKLFLRLAQRYTTGAKHYGDRNWERGINDEAFLDSYYESAFRHIIKYLACEKDEDHASAFVWNLAGIYQWYQLEKKC